ncbi:hypothetical protein LPE509_00502 [Legionella pneumophila subsp. pneumophila LPE509]|nr:hypothetical protein LPE509_00502 [Legionella pneumophila subsp. pneumophila LPE509]
MLISTPMESFCSQIIGKSLAAFSLLIAQSNPNQKAFLFIRL